MLSIGPSYPRDHHTEKQNTYYPRLFPNRMAPVEKTPSSSIEMQQATYRKHRMDGRKRRLERGVYFRFLRPCGLLPATRAFKKASKRQ
jgi:hypothetical protein